MYGFVFKGRWTVEGCELILAELTWSYFDDARPCNGYYDNRRFLAMAFDGDISSIYDSQECSRDKYASA